MTVYLLRLCDPLADLSFKLTIPTLQAESLINVLAEVCLVVACLRLLSPKAYDDLAKRRFPFSILPMILLYGRAVQRHHFNIALDIHDTVRFQSVPTHLWLLGLVIAQILLLRHLQLWRNIFHWVSIGYFGCMFGLDALLLRLTFVCRARSDTELSPEFFRANTMSWQIGYLYCLYIAITVIQQGLHIRLLIAGVYYLCRSDAIFLVTPLLYIWERATRLFSAVHRPLCFLVLLMPGVCVAAVAGAILTRFDPKLTAGVVGLVTVGVAAYLSRRNVVAAAGIPAFLRAAPFFMDQPLIVLPFDDSIPYPEAATAA